MPAAISNFVTVTQEQESSKFNGLTAILPMILALNLLDSILTTIWISAGHATEHNPLMASALGHGWLSFAVVKFALVSFGVYLLWRRRHHPLAVGGMLTALAVYAAVLIHHINGAMQLV